MFWKKEKTYKENIDYKFVEFNEDISAVELLKPPYKSVIYHYGNVKFVQEGELGVLNFNYSIINTGIYGEDELQNNNDFIQVIGDILTHLITIERGNNGQTRKNDIEEFDAQ